MRSTAEARRLSSDLARVGSVLAERYELIEVLGQGGMGTVYKARHYQLDRFVAVKLLLHDLAEDPMARSRFLREAKSSSKITHINVVQLVDYGELPDATPYLVMEFLEGKTLSDLISLNSQLPCEQAIEIFIQVCNALHYAHGRGIIHRDLKPGNIMIVNNEGEEIVKVVDFGLAKAANVGEESQKLTQTGEVYGSPVYMSPEQCLGRNIDARSDVYSMGIVMYETLTGMLPLAGANIAETIARQLTEEPKPFKLARPDLSIPLEIEAIVMQALSKDAADRQASMLELMEQLEGNAPVSRKFAGKSSRGARSQTAGSLRKDTSLNQAQSQKFQAIALIMTVLGVIGIACGGFLAYQSFSHQGGDLGIGKHNNNNNNNNNNNAFTSSATSKTNKAGEAYSNAEQNAAKPKTPITPTFNNIRAGDTLHPISTSSVSTLPIQTRNSTSSFTSSAPTRTSASSSTSVSPVQSLPNTSTTNFNSPPSSKNAVPSDSILPTSTTESSNANLSNFGSYAGSLRSRAPRINKVTNRVKTAIRRKNISDHESQNSASTNVAADIPATHIPDRKRKRRRDWSDYSYGVERKDAYTHSWDVPVAGTSSK